MYLLARATGWGETYLWNMSYSRGLMYLHAHLLYQGGHTRWAVATADERAEVDDKFDSLLNRPSLPDRQVNCKL